jgi:hypothetical protein
MPPPLLNPLDKWHMPKVAQSKEKGGKKFRITKKS